ncbi:MAG: hypothetical protein J7K26_02175 [Candidatus Aenigmarchaeota archaeon]|nr:hypothetical protein [Candidatus Aenigmarchaeota archaeon]
MIHPEKINDFKNSISSKEILNIIRIRDCGNLLSKFKNKTNKTWSELISCFEIFSNFNSNTIRNWSYDFYPIPLSVIIWLCDKLNKDYFKYIPKELSVVLWVHNKISTKQFNKIAKVKKN